MLVRFVPVAVFSECLHDPIRNYRRISPQSGQQALNRHRRTLEIKGLLDNNVTDNRWISFELFKQEPIRVHNFYSKRFANRRWEISKIVSENRHRR